MQMMNDIYEWQESESKGPTFPIISSIHVFQEETLEPISENPNQLAERI